jgi:VIT1/CCC1 family predicted Fe2+/Mn2+ transporter
MLNDIGAVVALLLMLAATFVLGMTVGYTQGAEETRRTLLGDDEQSG